MEINYTRDDFIERAILILNPENSGMSEQVAREKAGHYMQGVLATAGKARPRARFRAFLWVLLGAGIGAAVSALCLLL